MYLTFTAIENFPKQIARQMNARVSKPTVISEITLLMIFTLWSVFKIRGQTFRISWMIIVKTKAKFDILNPFLRVESS